MIKTLHRSFLCISVLLISFSSELFAQQAPFTKGVNLTSWFQAPSANQIPFNKYTKLDFEQIQSLGCDVIRLPINLHAMTSGTPDYVVDPLFLTFLDQSVDWVEELGIHLILDNHTFDVATNTNPNIYIPLEKIWKQMAAHYKDRSTYIHFEILNEPHGISSAIWGQIQQRVIDTIRTVDTKHSIVVGDSPLQIRRLYGMEIGTIFIFPSLPSLSMVPGMEVPGIILEGSLIGRLLIWWKLSRKMEVNQVQVFGLIKFILPIWIPR